MLIFVCPSTYHPQGNDQYECMNTIECKSIALSLKSEGLCKTEYIKVILLALSSIKGLFVQQPMKLFMNECLFSIEPLNLDPICHS